MPGFTEIMNKLDTLVAPPPNYANLTYYDRLARHFQQLKEGKNRFGNLFHLMKLGLMLGLSWILSPLALLLKKLGFHFINIDLAQIGTTIYLDILIREDRLTRNTPKYKMLAMGTYFAEGNQYLNNLYKDYVIFIRNPFLKLLLSPFFVSDVFEDNSFRYDTVVHTEVVAHDIWSRYAGLNNNKPLISFPNKDLPKVKALLEKYLPAGQKFVTVHVRDSGFYNDPSRNTRNADIQTYKEAFQYLISQGYAIIRLGNETADNIDAMKQECGPLLFDYAHSDIRSPMMDCYFLSRAAFFIGSSSGPATVPMLFGVNSCNVNAYTAANAPNFIKGDITTIKKFRYKNDNALVPFANLMIMPLARNPSVGKLEEIGVIFENNSSQEILNTVSEFVETPRDVTSPAQAKAKAYIRPDNFGYGAPGNFSNTILKVYPEFN